MSLTSILPNCWVFIVAVLWSVAASSLYGEESSEVIAVPSQGAESNGSRCHAPQALSLSSVDIGLPAGLLPSDFSAQCAATHPPMFDRRIENGWGMTDHHWSATCLRHRPLYFEEINAERYGYTTSYFFQPLISAGRFSLSISALPYKMAVDRPQSCTYTLGNYRPGSCVPRRLNRMPLKINATIAQVGIVAGLILLIP